MGGCNSSFITVKRPFIEWMAATEIVNLNTFQKRDVMPPEIMMAPLKDMDAYATL